MILRLSVVDMWVDIFSDQFTGLLPIFYSIFTQYADFDIMADEFQSRVWLITIMTVRRDHIVQSYNYQIN